MVCSVLFFVPLVRLIRFALIHNKMKALKIGNLLAPVPIVQGGMGVGISLHKLAGAVAASGGMGLISTAQIGFREPDFKTNFVEANLRAIRREMQKAREIFR